MVDAVPAGIFYVQSKFKSVKRLVFTHRYNYLRREPFCSKPWWPAVSIDKFKRTSIVGSWSNGCATFIGVKIVAADNTTRGKQLRRHNVRRSV